MCASLAAWSSVAQAPAKVVEPEQYRLSDYRAPVPETLHGATVMHTAELANLIKSRHVVLIDVLPAPTPPADSRPGLPRLPLPHSDLAGSVWLPDTGRGAIGAALENWFRARLRAATNGVYSQPTVFYCLSQCWMSWNAAKRAVSYGYTHVIWYPDGADGWQAAGLPVQGATALRP